MGILNGLSNLNALWLVIIIALGLCFITISVVLLLLERAKLATAEDFSEKDRKLIVGLVEERIDELTAKFDLFKEDMDSATQIVFNKITSKIDDLKTSPNPLTEQKQSGKIDALIPVISNLTELIEGISKKVDAVQEKLEQVESRIDLELHKQNNG